MSKEYLQAAPQESRGFRETVGGYMIPLGLVGGGIGLLISGELAALGALVAATGYGVKKSGENARLKAA